MLRKLFLSVFFFFAIFSVSICVADPEPESYPYPDQEKGPYPLQKKRSYPVQEKRRQYPDPELVLYPDQERSPYSYPDSYPEPEPECLELDPLQNGQNCVLTCNGNGADEFKFEKFQCQNYFKVELENFSASNLKFPENFPFFSVLFLKNLKNFFSIGEIELFFPEKLENLIVENSPLPNLEAWELQ